MSLIRNITKAEIAEFKTNGVVHLQNFFDPKWASMLRDLADFVLKNPGKLANELANKSGQGRFFSDTFLWHQNDEFKKFIYNSPAVVVVRQVIESSKINIIFDRFLIKEPNTNEPTAWHHDLTYWPIKGPNVVTLWLALDNVTEQTGSMEFVKGSHLWDKRYHPVAFVDPTKYSTPSHPSQISIIDVTSLNLFGSIMYPATAPYTTVCSSILPVVTKAPSNAGVPTKLGGPAIMSSMTLGQISRRCCGNLPLIRAHRSIARYGQLYGQRPSLQ
tara:strand:+ start:2638 stop:3456 length:819 start_codon:yes stop_codon:yes gene_type:complete